MSHQHEHMAVAPRNMSGAYKWAVLLNAGYVCVEAMAGLLTGSLALLADAAHNLTDVGGLLIAWGAAWAAARPPSGNFSYGFGKGTIVAALANAMAILAGAGAVVWEAIHRFNAPADIPAGTVMLVASIGIMINVGTALLFRTESSHDLNAKGAYLHMAADAAVSGAVVVSAGLMMVTQWTWLDPVTAILVSLLIAWAAFGLLRSASRLMFDGTPPGVNREAIAAWLLKQPGVADLHDLHVWPLSTTLTALTVHLVMPQGHPGDAFLRNIAEELDDHFTIGHVAVQIETGTGDACRLSSTKTI